MQEYLKPVSNTVKVRLKYLEAGCIGKQITIYNDKTQFPDLTNMKIAIVGVGDNDKSEEESFCFEALRLSFYSLHSGNWSSPIADIGDIAPGHSRSDTLFAVQKVTETLLQQDVIPILLGGGQDLVYGQYRGYTHLNKMLHYVNIDSQFDLGDMEGIITNRNYVGKMVSTKPYRLFNYTVLGYQSYYNNIDEIALLDHLLFDAFRLGDFTADITKVEPYLRDADMVSVDITSVQAACLGNLHCHPNGWNSREVCALARYAGMSNSCKSFSITEIDKVKLGPQAAMLLAQIIWYFLEGVNFRIADENFNDENHFKNYQVPIKDLTLHFKKSLMSGRWWVKLPKSLHSDTKIKSVALLPCSYEDYLTACDQELPERWLKAQRKLSL